ncbi:hypothetical protein D3C84_716180 [compost metagenome]
MIPPVSISIISDIFLANSVLDDIFTTGAIGLPVGVPKPVVNNTILAPEPTIAVVHSTSFPGVHNNVKPASLIYSP